MSSEKWIQEEEKIVSISSNPTFHPLPLKTIAVRFIYLNAQHEILGSVASEMNLGFEQEQALSSRINWQTLSELADSNSELYSERYKMEEVALFHIVRNYDLISSGIPVAFEPIVSWKETNVMATLDIFHDLSEVCVLMRPSQKLKSILKTGASSSAKTKKVRIQEPNREGKRKPASSSRKTQRIVFKK